VLSTTKLTNVFLLVISGCLALIVLKLYAPDFPMADAHAAADAAALQPVQVSNVPLPVRLAGDEPIRVQLYWHDVKRGWLPVGVDGGALVIRQ
jgi:hypothetical protein